MYRIAMESYDLYPQGSTPGGGVGGGVLPFINTCSHIYNIVRFSEG